MRDVIDRLTPKAIATLKTLCEDARKGVGSASFVDGLDARVLFHLLCAYERHQEAGLMPRSHYDSPDFDNPENMARHLKETGQD